MSNDFEPVKNEKTECKIEFNDNFSTFIERLRTKS